MKLCYTSEVLYYEFASRKGNSHLKSQAVSKLVKSWCKAINLTGIPSATPYVRVGVISNELPTVWALRFIASGAITPVQQLPCGIW